MADPEETRVEEPEVASPYKPPTPELTAEYSEVFALTKPLPRRLDKFVFDKIVAFAVLVIAVPILAVTWFAYKLEGLLIPANQGPMFYYYWSMAGGRKIKKWKIRAIRQDCIDAELAKEHDWRATKNEWRKDCRTKVGHFAKSYCFDELPQFWSVLKGDMSIVGPRPLAIHHYERDLAQGNVARSLLTGGILGLGHIRKGTAEMGDPRFEYQYLRHMPQAVSSLQALGSSGRETNLPIQLEGAARATPTSTVFSARPDQVHNRIARSLFAHQSFGCAVARERTAADRHNHVPADARGHCLRHPGMSRYRSARTRPI